MKQPTEQDAAAMTAMLTGSAVAWLAQGLATADWLTQPTRIEKVEPAGLVTFRLASGMLVTITVTVDRPKST